MFRKTKLKMMCSIYFMKLRSHYHIKSGRISQTLEVNNLTVLIFSAIVMWN